jgi:hypothetical protein
LHSQSSVVLSDLESRNQGDEHELQCEEQLLMEAVKKYLESESEVLVLLQSTNLELRMSEMGYFYIIGRVHNC